MAWYTHHPITQPCSDWIWKNSSEYKSLWGEPERVHTISAVNICTVWTILDKPSRVFLSSWWIVFELMNDARTRKNKSRKWLTAWRTIYIYIDKFHSKLVYVGLTQACPNYQDCLTLTAQLCGPGLGSHLLAVFFSENVPLLQMSIYVITHDDFTRPAPCITTAVSNTEARRPGYEATDVHQEGFLFGRTVNYLVYICWSNCIYMLDIWPQLEWYHQV